MENAFEQTGAIVAAIRRALPTGEREQKAAQLPALNLAFIGDTVFDLYVRTLLVTQADAKVQDAIRAAEAKLGDTGRVLVRESGTEPLVRVMVEAQDAALCAQCCEGIAQVIREQGWAL